MRKHQKVQVATAFERLVRCALFSLVLGARLVGGRVARLVRQARAVAPAISRSTVTAVDTRSVLWPPN